MEDANNGDAVVDRDVVDIVFANRKVMESVGNVKAGRADSGDFCEFPEFFAQTIEHLVGVPKRVLCDVCPDCLQISICLFCNPQSAQDFLAFRPAFLICEIRAFICLGS